MDGPTHDGGAGTRRRREEGGDVERISDGAVVDENAVARTAQPHDECGSERRDCGRATESVVGEEKEDGGDEGSAGNDVRHPGGVHPAKHLVGGEFRGRAAAEREARKDHLARPAGEDLRETRGEDDAGEQIGRGEAHRGHLPGRVGGRLGGCAAQFNNWTPVTDPSKRVSRSDTFLESQF